MDAKVYLLYEGDEWLSLHSLVLMGVFTSEKELESASNKVIHQKIDRNFNAEGYNDGWCKEEMKEDFAKKILKELLERRQTQRYTINYIIKEAELNKLEEV